MQLTEEQIRKAEQEAGLFDQNDQSKATPQSSAGISPETIKKAEVDAGLPKTIEKVDWGSKSWSEVFSSAVSNFGDSWTSNLTAITEVVTKPKQTASMLGRVAGLGLTAGKFLKGGGIGPADFGMVKKSLPTLEALFAPYTSVAGFKEYLATDPVGFTSDLATLLPGGFLGKLNLPTKITNKLKRPAIWTSRIAEVGLDPAGAAGRLTGVATGQLKKEVPASNTPPINTQRKGEPLETAKGQTLKDTFEEQTGRTPKRADTDPDFSFSDLELGNDIIDWLDKSEFNTKHPDIMERLGTIKDKSKVAEELLSYDKVSIKDIETIIDALPQNPKSRVREMLDAKIWQEVTEQAMKEYTPDALKEYLKGDLIQSRVKRLMTKESFKELTELADELTKYKSPQRISDAVKKGATIVQASSGLAASIATNNWTYFIAGVVGGSGTGLWSALTSKPALAEYILTEPAGWKKFAKETGISVGSQIGRTTRRLVNIEENETKRKRKLGLQGTVNRRTDRPTLGLRREY